MAEIFVVETRGVGKPDYTREVSSGQVRPGILLKYNQQLVEFVYAAQDLVIPSPFVPWMKGLIPHGGTHTAIANPTVMTDAVAAFGVNALIGMIIYNLTDKSQGIVVSNTANTVTVVALAGGTLNTWTTGDAYVFGAHLIDLSTGIPAPYTILAGYSLSLIEQRLNFNQDVEGWIFVDGLLIARPAGASNGSMIYQGEIAYFSTLLLDPTAAAPHLIDYQIINRGLADMGGGITLTTILEAIGTPPFPTEKDTKCPKCGQINRVGVMVTRVKCSRCGNTYILFVRPYPAMPKGD